MSRLNFAKLECGASALKFTTMPLSTFGIVIVPSNAVRSFSHFQSISGYQRVLLAKKFNLLQQTRSSEIVDLKSI